MNDTIGSKLIALRNRAGMTLAEVARQASYSGPSSVQVYFNPDYDTPLRGTLALRLGNAMMGRGEPPIELNEVFALSELEPEAASRYSARLLRAASRKMVELSPEPTTELLDPPTLKGQPRDVPVFGSALAADLRFDTEGRGPEPVEITNFSMGEAITYVRRPPGLDGQKRVYAIFVSGSSMEPRYRPGDPVFVDPQRPPSIGDDVIVQLLNGDDSHEIVTGLIKTLVRRTSSSLELEQYTPALRFEVPTERIAHIHRVIPWREAFGM